MKTDHLRKGFPVLVRLLAMACLVGAAVPLAAQEGGPRSQYIVVLKTGREVPNPAPGSPPVRMAEPDFGKFGGTVTGKWANRRVVTLPDAVADQVRQLPSVLYMQHVIVGNRTQHNSVLARQSESLHPAADSTPMTWFSGEYRYDGSGNIKAAGVSTALYGDGKPTLNGYGQTNTYVYDTAERLVSGTVNNATTNAEGYWYDSFGNLIERDGSIVYTMPVDASSNRLQGVPYDAAGNVTQNGVQPYLWDPFNLMVEKDTGYPMTQEYYVYTADDERIGVLNAAGWSWSIRDFDGKVIRELEADPDLPDLLPWLWVEDHVYRDGQLLAGDRELAEGGKRHFHLDHLGTPRLITDGSGMMLGAHDYFPFGAEQTSLRQEIAIHGFDRPEPMDFTGHERDFTGGTDLDNANYLDYMHARYYASFFDRFLSVDPLLGDPRVPQSWNRYTYARNSPVVFNDPTGEYIDVSDLSSEERSMLVAGLKAFTGNTYAVDPKTNYIILVTVGTDASATATAFVNNLINSPNAYNVAETTRPGESWWNASQNRIELDFHAFDNVNYNGIDPRTFNLGSTAIHEWRHETTGLYDTPDGQLMTPTPEDYSWTGPIVDAVNVMRTERGLPTRTSYYAQPVRPAGFLGLLGIGKPRSGQGFFDPKTGRMVLVINDDRTKHP